MHPTGLGAHLADIEMNRKSIETNLMNIGIELAYLGKNLVMIETCLTNIGIELADLEAYQSIQLNLKQVPESDRYHAGNHK